jgi:outer membrane protein OmpA-like peptidoglycan-associated protein
MVRVSASTTPSLPDSAYQWSINGENTSTAKVLQFGTTGRSAGTYQIGLTVSAAGFNNGTGSTSVTVREYRTPSGSVSASPSVLTLENGKPVPTSTLSASFSGLCGDPIGPARYSASEGTVNGNIYDPSTVAFDTAGGQQQKQITITATATDAKGGSGTATTSITVRRNNPPVKRLPDLVFARGSARVNNCGKRLLLEELKTYLDQDPTGQVIFIGHTDEKEPKLKDLDLKRALNAAAVISGGKGICLNFAASQILVGASGNDQGAADFQPYFCGTSATPVHERGGQTITDKDKRAQFRRVEIWFVPTGGTLPPSASGYKSAADLGVAKLGCPK